MKTKILALAFKAYIAYSITTARLREANARRRSNLPCERTISGIPSFQFGLALSKHPHPSPPLPRDFPVCS